MRRLSCCKCGILHDMVIRMANGQCCQARASAASRSRQSEARSVWWAVEREAKDLRRL